MIGENGVQGDMKSGLDENVFFRCRYRKDFMGSLVGHVDLVGGSQCVSRLPSRVRQGEGNTTSR